MLKRYPKIEETKSLLAETDRFAFAYMQIMGLDQQYLLYAASNDIFFPGEIDDSTRGEKEPQITLAEARALIERITKSDYARTHWPLFAAGPTTTVDNDVHLIEDERFASTGERKPYTGAFTDDHDRPARIHLGKSAFAMQKPVVLHELCHAVEMYERPDVTLRRVAMGHGPQFARTFIQMIHEFDSPERAAALEDAFNYAGVQVAPASQSGGV